MLLFHIEPSGTIIIVSSEKSKEQLRKESERKTDDTFDLTFDDGESFLVYMNIREVNFLMIPVSLCYSSSNTTMLRGPWALFGNTAIPQCYGDHGHYLETLQYHNATGTMGIIFGNTAIPQCYGDQW